MYFGLQRRVSAKKSLRSEKHYVILKLSGLPVFLPAEINLRVSRAVRRSDFRSFFQSRIQ